MYNEYLDNDDNYLDKNKLIVVQNWSKLEHGATGYNRLDNYFKTKKLVITTFCDEYDASSSEHIIDFINDWSLRIERYRLSNYIDINEPTLDLTPYFALADTYIFKDYCFAVDKTYLIKKIQRKWRAYYNRLKHKIIKLNYQNESRNDLF